MSTGNHPKTARRVSSDLPAHLWAFSAAQLVDGFRLKAISPVEVAKAVLARMEALNPSLNAYCWVDRETALEQAQASERRWHAGRELSLLDGVPVSIKDNIQVGGMPTLYGSLAVERETAWQPDGPAPARLREAGAVMLGKTAMPEFAHKIVTDSPLTGVTRNPWDLKRSPGGSSGGAAAAVAAGLGPLALGTDGGGSIRVPCAWSGIFGLKPTFGRVPHYPRGPFGPLSHVGPMTRTVRDAAAMMQVICRPDVRDWHALPADNTDYVSGLDAGVKGMRIAFSSQLGLEDVSVEPEIISAIEAAVEVYRRLGATLVPADPPAVAQCNAVHGTMWASYCARVVRSYPGKRQTFDPSLLALADAGEGLPRDAFLEATIGRIELGRTMGEFFAGYDLLLCPVYPTVAPKVTPDPHAPALLPRFTNWCNQTGVPAASVVAGLSTDGLPIGIQLVGRRFADADVLRASFAFEQAHGSCPWPPSIGATPTVQQPTAGR
jgi:aspartyl-tRNA(Asn)/glutamyl-tRNA(Gln) amidotransferase subunit A